MIEAVPAALEQLRSRLTELEAERAQIGTAIIALEALNGNKLLPAKSSASTNGQPATLRSTPDRKSSARRLYESDPSLSITDIAERVGVSAATIYAWRKTEAWERAE